MKSPAKRCETDPTRVIAIVHMAAIIVSSRRPLSDMRGIVLALDGAGIGISDVRRYIWEAITKARLMRGLA